MLKHPQRTLIASFKQENGKNIAHLFTFYLELDLQCTKVHCCVHYNCTKNVSISSVKQWLMVEEKEMKTLYHIAETIKPLGNSSFEYQIMDRSRHTIST